MATFLTFYSRSRWGRLIGGWTIEVHRFARRRAIIKLPISRTESSVLGLMSLLRIHFHAQVQLNTPRKSLDLLRDFFPRFVCLRCLLQRTAGVLIATNIKKRTQFTQFASIIYCEIHTITLKNYLYFVRAKHKIVSSLKIIVSWSQFDL